MKTNAMEMIEKVGLLPLVNVSDPGKAVPIAKALADGGIPIVEVTLRDKTALESLANIHKELPDTLVGAGTVKSPEQAAAALDAGADFIVSPGVNPSTIKYCQEKGVAIVPGAVTATELELGTSLGLDVFKFFPADLSGGLDVIKALRGPFGNVRFVPTGGVSLANMKPYVEDPAILAIGGSFLTPKEAVAASDWASVTKTAERAVEISLGFAMGHVGINCNSVDEANTTAGWFNDRFGLKPREIDISFFAGSAVEAMKKPSFGEHGHIGIACNSIARALYHLERKGLKFRFFKTNPEGKIIAAYLEEEVGGFAVHLCGNGK
ncbi:MAG: bifunctional 4-hydroxy-2-oxoglutarate aldolase/2-dehydro-3-deoxy-phosphogluconate aldolase [Thermoguttaceae bacterium]|nr:bifunctional 4-hydroxy-2-oxoglutarate aldolase/2-dehydro-3-deoxy-phosphogluconate aldolase [Thermoguttaceae bacterium]